jgi:hypothetical protein
MMGEFNEQDGKLKGNENGGILLAFLDRCGST